MNYQMQKRGHFDRISAVYWSVSQVTLEGVLDQIRTRLVELVAEMRAAMPDEADVPSSTVADNAVSIVIHGGSPRVNVTAAQALGDGSHDISAGATSRNEGLWKKLGSVLVGTAIIIGTLVAIAVWQNWNPF